MKRRHFLQATGSTASAIAFGNSKASAITTFMAQADRYGHALAQPTPRKHALLVGINTYSESSDRGLRQLYGCETDVQLQKELLIHRFGFQTEDIKILTNQDATRDTILKTFETHLIQQARPDDVVVFHFSGHGSRLLDSDPITKNPANSALVPAQAIHLNPDKSVDDIMGKTLFLLISALQTHNVTTVLDSCYSGGGTRGSGRIRSDTNDQLYKPSAAELTYQKRWMDKLGLSSQQLRDRRRAKVAKGAVLAAATEDQLAIDGNLAGFYAGLFTYFLTQYLWESASSVSEAEAIVRRSIFSEISDQTPVFDLEPGFNTKPVYFISPSRRSAQAVVQSVINNQATLWLGGLDKITLDSFGKESTFSTLDSIGILTLINRDGLIATATVKGTVKPGTLLRESARVIPDHIQLRIGLDPSLSGIAAQIQLPRLEVIPAQKDGSYSKSVHYILSRVTATNQSRSSDAPLNSIALFSPSLELLPNSFDKAGESVQAALSRLQSKLQSLIATHLVRQTLNASASKLNVDVAIQQENQPTAIVAKTSTRQGAPTLGKALPLKTPFQLRVTNREASSLYLLIALVSPSGRMSVIFPNDFVSANFDGEIAPNSERLIPDPKLQDGFHLFSPLAGRGEALIITSRNPLTATYKQLRTLVEEQSSQQRPIDIGQKRGVSAIAALLSDLGKRSGDSSYTISTDDVATLSLSFEVT
ncbi:MAG: caspase family protein [Phormidesmis sp. CAN_BIN44]|nr:caspase family protein [Phormidesmis sp. CAN_BIN44]